MALVRRPHAATVHGRREDGRISCNGMPGITSTVVQTIPWTGNPNTNHTGDPNTPNLVKYTAYVGVINVPTDANRELHQSGVNLGLRVPRCAAYPLGDDLEDAVPVGHGGRRVHRVPE